LLYLFPILFSETLNSLPNLVCLLV